jgi:hypothetical protein
MKSKIVGENISKVEVVNISRHGFWLFVHGKEYFLSFKDYPWFKEAKIAGILNVELPQSNHLFWPDLDVDLEIDSLENPERYPLSAKTIE